MGNFCCLRWSELINREPDNEPILYLLLLVTQICVHGRWGTRLNRWIKNHLIFIYLLLIPDGKHDKLLNVAPTDAAKNESSKRNKKVVDFDFERWYINKVAFSAKHNRTGIKQFNKNNC